MRCFGSYKLEILEITNSIYCVTLFVHCFELFLNATNKICQYELVISWKNPFLNNI